MFAISIFLQSLFQILMWFCGFDGFQRLTGSNVTAFSFIFVEYTKNIYGWSDSAPPGAHPPKKRKGGIKSFFRPKSRVLSAGKRKTTLCSFHVLRPQTALDALAGLIVSLNI